LFSLCALLAACSSKSQNGGDDPGGGGNGVDGGTLVGADGGAVLADGGGGSTREECADINKLVYVISRQNMLYRFQPDKLVFTPVGLLKCPSYGSFPTSMAVDRLGYAWVIYSDGSLWKVDTKDASCAQTTYQPDQEGFHRFGMGFSTDGATGSAETLFVADHDGKGLAKIDLKTMKLTTLGSFEGILTGRAAELTGTGDGRLYGFFTTSPAQLGELVKASGSTVSSKELTNVNTGTEYAFSFWGGDFYLYTANDTGGLPQDQKGSSVTRYRPSDQSITVVMQNIGFNIVGAGVSTCAPTTLPPPK
jgi:hypothetical protein